MSYGEHAPTLDFTGMRFACLSGDNGNGKSALLDAMTWALFGKTRAKSEEDVIRRGTTDCQVVFDFEVDGVLYRVDRRRTKRGASWELQVRQDDETFRPLTGAASRETEAKIRNLLRMDYDMFLASGYVAQGRADEFTRITPAKRKEILADILNIGFYEQLEKMAKERHDEARDRETDAEREINSLDATIAKRPLFEQRLQEAENRRTGLFAEAESIRAAFEQKQGIVHAMREREKNTLQLRERVRENEEVNRNEEAQLLAIEDKIARAENILVRRPEILATFEKYNALTDRSERLNEEYRQFVAFQRQASDLERRIGEAERTLDRERYNLQCEIELLERELQEIPRLEAEMLSLQEQMAAYGDLNQLLLECEERQKSVEEQWTHLREENAAAKAEQGILQKRLDALTASTAALCEYCGQPLLDGRRQELIQGTREALAEWDTRLATIKTQGNEVKRLMEAAQREKKQMQADQVRVGNLSHRLAQASQEQLRLSERAKQLPGLQRRFTILDTRLKERDYALAEFEELTRVSAQLERLERVEQQLNEVRGEIQRCGDVGRQRLELDNAEQDALAYPPQRDELKARIESRTAKIAQAKSMVVKALNEIAELPVHEAECAELTTALQQAEAVVRSADREINTCQTELDRIVGLEAQKKQREEERRAAARERDTYKELVGAFGKKGIQQLIIERALPEIQEEANEILGKMTNHAMRVELRSTREGKAKATGTMETLDIIISDDLGERPYEMYSGGEAFRVNFALRVALSKVLSHRAGAPLQTLILDEGFGTQDPRGREAVVEALQAVQDQFALILVITHIEELKDAFSTRIEVVKGPDGSTFAVQ